MSIVSKIRCYLKQKQKTAALIVLMIFFLSIVITEKQLWNLINRIFFIICWCELWCGESKQQNTDLILAKECR